MKRRLTIIAAAVVLVVSSAMADADLDNGLVTWFSFDEVGADGKVANKADMTCPLTLGSGVALDADDAVMGHALSFAGELNQAATFISPALTNCTVAFWCRRGENDGPYAETNQTQSPYLFSDWGSTPNL